VQLPSHQGRFDAPVDDRCWPRDTDVSIQRQLPLTQSPCIHSGKMQVSRNVGTCPRSKALTNVELPCSRKSRWGSRVMVACTLVHSPLVGPSTWSLVADELRARGWIVAVPSLREAATAGDLEGCCEAAATESARGTGVHVLVAHSGSGRLAPLIAHRMGALPEHIVLVDAIMPPEVGVSDVNGEFARYIAKLAVDGILPPWSEWFGPETMADEVPEPELRMRTVEEMPRLPLELFRSISVPASWSRSKRSYVLLSEAYRLHADQARARGWPVVELPGRHLDILNRPVKVAAAISEIARGA
jgi:hypothetical protein